MMKITQGSTTNTFIYRNELRTDCIINYNLVNNTAGSIVINVCIGRTFNESIINRISPKNLTLAVGESFQHELPFVMDGFIKITTTGSLDYYISLRSL